MFATVYETCRPHSLFLLLSIFTVCTPIHITPTASIAKPISCYSLRYRQLTLPYKRHLHSFCPICPIHSVRHIDVTLPICMDQPVHHLLYSTQGRWTGKCRYFCVNTTNTHTHKRLCRETLTFPGLSLLITVDHCRSLSITVDHCLSLVLSQSSPWGGRDVVSNIRDYI